MASDDRQSQQFIREVDEELRRAQLKAIWDRFAPLIIGVCVLVVVVTAGYRGWLWWQDRQASQAGDRFMAALEKVEADRAAGEAELAKIAEEAGGGYAVLARLRLAGEKAAAGEKSEAIAGYDAVAADGSASEPLRDLARLRAALLALDTGDLAGAKERAEPLVEAGNPWRSAAREVLGLAAYKTGALQEAREHFTAIQQDAETPPELWVRSGMMVALIDGQLAAPASAEGTEGAEAPAPAEDQPAATGSAPPTASSAPDAPEAVAPEEAEAAPPQPAPIPPQ